jgi:outer membrane receptor protein involved in Fe transport
VVLPDTPRESAPDTTRSYEIGTKGEFLDKRLSIDASVYYIDWKDIQLQETAPNGFKYTGNAGGAKSQGVELTVDAHPADGLTLGATFSYDDAVLTKGFPSNGQYYGVPGDRLPLTSQFSGSLSADWEFPFRSGTGYVGAVGTYVGQRLGVFVGTPQRQDLPGYTRLDLHGGLRSDAWSVNVYANNITDTRGLLDGGTGYFYPPARVYIVPRTVGINIAYTF